MIKWDDDERFRLQKKRGEIIRIRKKTGQMIDMGRLSSFKFYLKKTLEGVESGDTVYANILSKSSNVGIDEALKYIESQTEAGTLGKEKSAEVTQLVKRFTKFR